LNTVGPIALLANARAGFVTDALKQHIIDANRQLQMKLTPTCGVSIDNPDALPSFGEGPVTGHGACYNYTVSTPPRVAVGERGGVFFLPPGPGRAFLPWPMRGDAVPDDDLLPWRGYTVGFPVVDYSIAINQVMQGTSWQVAGAALDQLLPSVAPVGSPLAMTTNTDAIYKPVNLFRTNADDNVLRGVLNPYPDGSQPTFAGWHPMDGALRSVAAAANADGRVEIFGISRVGNIFHRWQQFAGDNNTWLPWAQMDGQLNSITVARNQDGTLQVFGTNPAGQVWTRNQILGGDQFVTVRPSNPVPAIDSWTAWKLMDGELSQAAAVSDASGLIHLFGINGSGLLFHRQQTVRNATDPAVSGAWSQWEQVEAPEPLKSIAVAIENGLIVPVIKGADQMNMLGLARTAANLAERARTKRLVPDDVQGGTFTITNVGVFGGLVGLPIINQPQAAILGIGTIVKRAVVIDDAIAIRPIVYLSLSYDHRIVDGADASRFMTVVKRELEKPAV
jgi:hypothetical protein